MDGARRRRRLLRSAIEPDINVTPLVDVVLVLLIIFMVVAPRMDQDVPVDLPGIFNPDPEVDVSVDPIKLSVAKAGEYWIGDQQYDLDGVIGVLIAEHAAEPSRRLILRADANLQYGDVRQVFSRAQEIGFPGLSFMVGERHRAAAQNAQAASEGDAAVAGATASAAGAS